MWQNGGSQSDFGGGGFLNNSQFESPSETKKENIRKSQNLIAVCISQIITSLNDTLKIGRVDAHLLRIVARVKSVEVSSTKIKYELEDDTGTIAAVTWLDGDSDNSNKGPLVEGTYCRIVGSARTQEGRRYIMLLQAEPLTDPNLLTEHLLAVMHNELAAHKLPTAVNQGGSSNMASTSGAMSNMVGGASVKVEGGGDIKDRVLQLIMGYANSDTGVSKTEVIRNFSKEMSARQIEEALEFLCNEGQVYTTVDDDHYKSTE